MSPKPETSPRALIRDATVLNFSDLQLDGVIVDYVYGYNSTAGQVVFYGEGGGKVPAVAGGGRLVLQETVAPAYVAPLELFYDDSGVLQTSFDTPLIYRWAAGGQVRHRAT